MKHNIFATLVIVVIFIACLFIFPANAQNDRQSLRYFGKAGTTELSGNVSFSYSSYVSNGNSGDGVSVFSLGPEIGYFVADGFEIGFNPGVSFLPMYYYGMLPTGATVVSTEKGSYTILQLFATAGYHFHLEGSSVTPFLQVPFGYTSLKSDKDDAVSGFSWGVKGGIKVVAADHLLLTFSLQYLALTFSKGGAKRDGWNYLSLGCAVGGFF